MKLYLTFLLNHFRSLLRTRVWTGGGIVIKIMVVLVGIYFCAAFFSMGYLADHLVFRFFPQSQPIEVVNTFLLSAFGMLISIRFFIQQSPDTNLQSFLHLPIKRSTLVHITQGVSLLTFINVLPLVFLVPFWTNFVLPFYTPVQSIAWFGSVIALVLFTHFLNNWLRMMLSKHPSLFGVVLVVFLGWVVLESLLGTAPIQDMSLSVFGGLLKPNGWLIGFLLLFYVVLIYYVGYRTTLRQLFEAPVHQEHKGSRLIQYFENWLTGLGPLGIYVLLELRMMFRNRRPRQLFFQCLFLLPLMAYLFIGSQHLVGIAHFGLLYLSGTFIFSYGQFMFSWESAFFDGQLARQVDLQEWVLAKILLLQGSALLLFFVALPLIGAVAPEYIWLYGSYMFYNIGISTPLVMLFATWNAKKIDLWRNAVMNYQGLSAQHWVTMIPLGLLPVILGMWFETVSLGWLIFGGIGLTGALCTPLWTVFLSRKLYQKKYQMAAGFRD